VVIGWGRVVGSSRLVGRRKVWIVWCSEVLLHCNDVGVVGPIPQCGVRGTCTWAGLDWG
jgi:selenophosphate synthetase-related protein